LHELLDTGIDSLKIEGRMKRPEYAAGVTGIYRRWLDRYMELCSAGYRQYLTEHDEAMAQDVRLLAELYNRGGFCGGYAFDTKGRGMICADRSNHTGVRVGRATVTGGDRPSAKLLLTEEIGPEEVLEFRSDEGIVYGEITTPKDMTRFDPDKPVMLRRDASAGRLPHRLSVFRMKQEALLSDIRETFLKNREAIPVCGTFYAAPGEPMRLTVTDEQERACVTVTGAIPEAARQNPMRPEQFTEKLRKTGGSGYTWTSLSAEVKDGLFVPVSAINELRREALAAYEDAVLTRGFRHLEEPDGDGTENPDENRETIFPFDTRAITENDRLSRNPASNDGSGNTEPRCAVSVMTPEQTEAAMRSNCVTDLLIDMEGDYPACLQIVRAEKEYGAAGKMILLAMPRAVKGERREQMLRETDRILGEGLIGGIVVRTVDQLAEAVRRKAADPSLTICADSTLHVTNAYAAGWLAEQGCDAVTLSPELKRSEITQAMAAGAWITVYERLPLMISEQCPVRTMFGCPGDGSNPTGTLTDGEGNAMPVRSICRYCHSVIFNADVTSLLGIFGEVLQKQPFGVRVSFTTESRKDAGRILKTLSEALRGSETADPEFDCRCTRGHWKRGVL
ncbi:MAG: DUF3656 domain-containing protein, partial [Lachnospiraceae bacterium]|nr:DUF3656 domain-containing protein [Lachnospiraceae bacterium]